MTLSLISLLSQDVTALWLLLKTSPGGLVLVLWSYCWLGTLKLVEPIAGYRWGWGMGWLGCREKTPIPSGSGT